MSKLVCPYCYETFAERQIEFRCTGRRGPKGVVCPTERDERLVQRMKDARPLPPAFAADGRKLSVAHQHCDVVTPYRICPHCHSQLPVHFGKVDSRLIAMIGAKETGKTIFMTVLLHELMGRLGARFDAAVVGSDDYTRGEFNSRYEDRLYRHGAVATATRSAGGDVVKPLVFKLTMERRGLVRTRNRDGILSFFDTAGEDLVSQSSVDLNVRYLSSASGIILLLDPLQIPGVRERIPAGIPLPASGPGSDIPLNVLSRVTELLQRASDKGPGTKLQTPLAVAFSKIDALRPILPPGSPLLENGPNGRASFEQADSETVHEHVRALLHDWGDGQIDQLLRKSYARFRYFGLSALGSPPTRDNRVQESGISPLRVQDPLLWLLSEFGTIPTAKD